jgi:hypothetical protein
VLFPVFACAKCLEIESHFGVFKNKVFCKIFRDFLKKFCIILGDFNGFFVCCPIFGGLQICIWVLLGCIKISAFSLGLFRLFTFGKIAKFSGFCQISWSRSNILHPTYPSKIFMYIQVHIPRIYKMVFY